MRAFVLLMLIGSTATADPRVLRLSAPAPDGTAYGREARAFAREVEEQTRGQLRIKWYLGGVTGDELATAERIRRGQLDGIASSGMLCNQLAPSFGVHHVIGLFQKQDEGAYVDQRLRPQVDAELGRAGFVNLGLFSVGPVVLFTRTPVRTMLDLKRLKLWAWQIDRLVIDGLRAMSVPVVPLPLEEAGRAYDEGRIDGFAAVPAAALVFQWSTRARNLTDLRLAFLRGCFLVAQRTLDELPIDVQQAVRAAGARLTQRLDEIARVQDEALLHHLFQKQGMSLWPPSAAFRSEFAEAAQAVRDHVAATLPAGVLSRTFGLLVEARRDR